MGNIKIKKKAEIEAEKLEQEQKKVSKEKFKGKTLSTKGKDELLEKIAKDLGYL